MAGATYVITRGRRIASVFLGAGLGSLITAIPTAFVTSEGRIVDSPLDLLFSLVLCAAVWLPGVAAFAFPIWLLIERRRKSPGWRTAAVCGLVLTPTWFVAVMLLLPRLFQEDYGISFWGGAMGYVLAVGALLSAVIGCFVGLVMWRFAYRRTAAPDLAETFS